MTTNIGTAHAAIGDRLEVRGLHGQPARCGEIVEVLGTAGHPRYRVRWEDGHESIVFPSDGVNVVGRAAAGHAVR
jgi:Domain of unknown function (DUF1918)